MSDLLGLDDGMDQIESILFVCRNVKVYKVGPRPSISGYKAADWEGNMIWEGRLRIVETGKTGAILKFEDANTGESFANAPYAPPGSSVEPVLDSSRYFVVRIVDEQGRKASVGMGFEERGDAFDFNVALQDHLKRLSPSSSSSSSSGPSSSNAPSKPAEPKKDYSLKAGQTFTISVPGASKTGAAKPKKVESAGGATPFILPPPPSGRKRE